MANRSLGTLTLDMIMQLGGFRSGTEKAKRELDRLGADLHRRSSRIAGSFKSLGIGLGLAFGVAEIVRATAEAEKAFANLENAVKNNAGAAGQSLDQLVLKSEELQRVTTFADDAIQGAQAQLLRFENIDSTNFERATEAVLDLAAGLGKDLQSASIAVGKALANPERGMKQLARVGIILTAQQEDVIKKLLKTGETAKAQAQILGFLEDAYGGAAEAARQNFGGALEGLKNAFGDLLEGKGGVSEATAGVNQLADLFADPKFKDAVATIIGAFLNFSAVTIKAIVAIFRPISDLIGLADEAGARIDHFFGRKPSDALEKKYFSLGAQIDSVKEKLRQLDEEQKRIEQSGGAEFSNFAAASAARRKAYEEELAALTKLRGVSRQPTNIRGVQTRINQGRTRILEQDKEDLKAIEKLYDETRTAQERYEEKVEEIHRLERKGLDPEVVTRALKQAREELTKDLDKKPAVTEAQKEFDSAAEKVAGFIKKLEEQRATLGMSEAESLRYAISQGEIAEAYEVMGDKADEIKPKIEGLVEATIRDTALQSIQDQIDALEEEADTLNLTATEAFRYNLTHGEMAKTLALTAEQVDALTKKFEDQQKRLEAARKEQERIAESKVVFEDTRTDEEELANRLKELKELATGYKETLDAATGEVIKSGIDQETYNRAIAQAVLEYGDATDAGELYEQRLAKINELLAAGAINQEAANAATAAAAKELKKAEEEAKKVFIEEAQREVENITAKFLIDFDSKNALDQLNQFLKESAAHIISARLSDKLFEGMDDVFDSLGDLLNSLIKKVAQWFDSIGSGAGGGAAGGGLLDKVFGFFAGLFDEGGFIPPNKVGIVGERDVEGLIRGNRSLFPERSPVMLAGIDGPQLVSGGATGMTVFSNEDMRSMFTQRVQDIASRAKSIEKLKDTELRREVEWIARQTLNIEGLTDARTIERANEIIRHEFITTSTSNADSRTDLIRRVNELTQRISEQSDRYVLHDAMSKIFASPRFAGFFADGGTIPIGKFGIGGERGLEGVFSGFKIADTPAAGKMGIVGGDGVPELIFGGATGKTIVPLDKISAMIEHLDLPFAGYFASGGFMPPNTFGIGGESGLEGVIAGNVRSLTNSLIQSSSTQGDTYNVYVTVDAPRGTVSRQTALQAGATIGRAIDMAKARNLRGR